MSRWRPGTFMDGFMHGYFHAHVFVAGLLFGHFITVLGFAVAYRVWENAHALP